MLSHLLADGTVVEVQFNNDNPNNPGGQHTNGLAPAWFKFDESPWRRAHTYSTNLAIRRDLMTMSSVEECVAHFGIED